MKAIQVTAIGGPDVLRLVEVPDPPTLPGTLRIRNRAVGVNFQDIQSRRHVEPGTALPFVPGTDFAGEVDEVGAGVEGFSIGDRVVGIHARGAYAEKTVVPSPLAVPLPDEISFEQAAACPVAGLAAYFLIQDQPVRAGMTVVVHAAAGSVGCFLGGLLRLEGAISIGLVSSDEKASVARRAGHTYVVNYKREDPLQRVRELTGGVGAEVVFDSVAGPKFEQSFEMTAAAGTVVLFGRAAGDAPPEAVETALLKGRRNLALRSYLLGTTIQSQTERLPKAYEILFEGLSSGAIFLPIETLPLEEAAQAQARIESQATVGKLVLLP